MDLTADDHSALARPQQKRRKVAPSAEDKQRIKAAATAVYDGMASLFNAEMNQPHMAAFMEPVSKQDYPSYHLLIKRPVHMKMIKKKISMGMYNKDIGKLHDDFSLVCTINLRSWCLVCVSLADSFYRSHPDLLERIRLQRARVMGLHRRQDARGLPSDALGSVRDLPRPSLARSDLDRSLVRVRRRRFDHRPRHRRVHPCDPERARTAGPEGDAQVWRWCRAEWVEPERRSGRAERE